MINLIFPVNFLNIKLNIIKSITERNNLFCQNLKFASNPTLIFNADMFKRKNRNNILIWLNF